MYLNQIITYLKCIICFKALNHTHPEIVLDEGINVLKMYFGAKKIGIYHVDNNKQSLRIKLRAETGKNTLPQSIFC